MQKRFEDMSEFELQHFVQSAPKRPSGFHELIPRDFDYTAYQNGRKAQAEIDRRRNEPR